VVKRFRAFPFGCCAGFESLLFRNFKSFSKSDWKEHFKVIDSDQILRMAEIIKARSIGISIKRSGTGMTVIFKG
jgi:hypothetical protein